MNIIQLAKDDSSLLMMTGKALVSLRKCYPNFKEWYEKKVLPNVGKDRQIFLALNHMDFGGAMILKNNSEKKICTLFVNEENRFNRLGSDFLRIASEELETYKLPITVSQEATETYFNARSYNFYTKETKKNMYKDGVDEYIGYVMFHNPDIELKRK